MSVSYNILYKLLDNNPIAWLDKLGRNENVMTDILMKICKTHNFNIDDIMNSNDNL